MLEALCCCSSVLLKWPASWLRQAPACGILQVGVQCAIAPFLLTGSAIAHACLGVSMRLSLPDACSMLKAGVGHHPSGNIASISCCCSNGVPTLSLPVHLGLPKVFNEALPISEQFFSLVIGGSSSWNFSKAPVAAMVPTKL